MFRALYFQLLAFYWLSACTPHESTEFSSPNKDSQATQIPSLDVLSIDALRSRVYGSEFQLIKQVKNNSHGYRSYMASYVSDGLKVYARIDIPNAPAPIGGYPILLHSHGWVGIEKAPSFSFFLNQQGSEARYIDEFAKNGYITITPGWRGHGTVDSVQAEGIEFMKAWDNSSYISPLFYAIDMLNALDSIGSLTQFVDSNKVNKKRVYLSGHSQGGDSAMLTLAIAGEDSKVRQSITAASIWAGCFLPRLAQGTLYGPMALTVQAFMSGDGSWTASAIGQSGKVNPDFLFSHPPHWITTTDKTQWTWQHQMYSAPTVREALKTKYDEMYQILHTANLTTNNYQLTQNEYGKTIVIHSTQIEQQYRNTDAIAYPQYLTEPLYLHHSDQDYYSPSYWNELLAEKVNAAGGQAKSFEYKGNTHSLDVSEYLWFSPQGTISGIEKMLEHDLSKFK